MPNRISNGWCVANQSLRERACVFKNRADLFAESDEWLVSCFPLPRQILQNLCAVLEPKLRSETKWSNPTPPHLQVLTTIGFLATGTFQRETGDRSGISQSNVSCAPPQCSPGYHPANNTVHSVSTYRCSADPDKRGFLCHCWTVTFQHKSNFNLGDFLPQLLWLWHHLPNLRPSRRWPITRNWRTLAQWWSALLVYWKADGYCMLRHSS